MDLSLFIQKKIIYIFYFPNRMKGQRKQNKQTNKKWGKELDFSGKNKGENPETISLNT